MYRKCTICKKEINLKSQNTDYFIEMKTRKDGTIATKAYHSNCYVNRETTKQRGAKTVQEAILYIREQKALSKDYITSMMAKDTLNKYIQSTYQVSYFPKLFYEKMASIFNGSHKGLTRPVPPEDLLDMWRRKQEYLDKVAGENQKKGKEFTPIGRVNYDLAILLNKYDSYLAWKEKNRLDNASNENKIAETHNHKIAYDYRQIIPKKENISSVNISSILDEI